MNPIIVAAAISANRNKHGNYNDEVNCDCCDPEKNPKTVNGLILGSVIILLLILL